MECKPQDRESKKDDLEKAKHAYTIISVMMMAYPEDAIDGNHWQAALAKHLCEGFHRSNFSYDEFLESIEEMTKCFKKLWDGEQC